MKSNLLLYVACLLCLNVFSQAPTIEWQKSYGGNIHEEIDHIQQTTDNGFIAVGYTNSTNGDVITGNPGGYDIWIAKLDSTGTMVWQRTLGGSQHDWAYNIQQTSDGGYIVAGATYSNNGDVTGNNGNYDCWIIRLDAVGTIIWQKNYGGSDYDYARSIKQTSDGGFIVAGVTSSTNGDVTGNHNALSDYWVLKLNSSGEIIWKKCLGGTGHEAAYEIQILSDGSYIITGVSSSLDGNVTGNHAGSQDFWVVKLNTNGDIVWQKSLGGISDDFSHSIVQTSDNGFIVTGYTYSNNGHITGNHGNADFWVVKLDSVGTIIWQKALGGTGMDWAQSIKQTIDGGYIVVGFTASNNGDVSGNHGDKDMWIVKLNNNGDVIWQKALGGTGDDRAYDIYQTPDGGYVVTGYSWSTDGDLINNNQGYGDVWIVKLSPENLSVSEYDASKFSIYPNPSGNFITIQNTANSTEYFDYKFIDLTGRIVKTGTSKNEPINIESLISGCYSIQIETETGKKITEKLIKN